MKPTSRICRSISLTTCLVALAAGASIAIAADKSTPVTVTNPTSSPVPVAPQGTTNVSGTVSVSGTVQTAVDVVPYSQQGSCSGFRGCQFVLNDVPADKRLIIEYVSGTIVTKQLPPVGAWLQLDVRRAPQEVTSSFAPFSLVGGVGLVGIDEGTLLVVSQTVKLYHVGASALTVGCQRTNTTEPDLPGDPKFFCQVNIVGNLVPLP